MSLDLPQATFSPCFSISKRLMGKMDVKDSVWGCKQILPMSCCTTGEANDCSPLMGLHFPNSAGWCPTNQLSAGGARRRREATELCSSSAADVFS